MKKVFSFAMFFFSSLLLAVFGRCRIVMLWTLKQSFSVFKDCTRSLSWELAFNFPGYSERMAQCQHWHRWDKLIAGLQIIFSIENLVQLESFQVFTCYSFYWGQKAKPFFISLVYKFNLYLNLCQNSSVVNGYLVA